MTRRSLLHWGYVAIGAVGAFAFLFLAVRIVGLSPAQVGAHPLLLTSLFAAALGWNLLFMWLYWRRVDEAAQEAQKFAWFFGGVAALVVTAPPMLFLRITGAPFLPALAPHGGNPGIFFAFGWLSLALAEVAGFMIVWAGWWLAKR